MKEYVVTCEVMDWLEYRERHKGCSEVNLANVKVYDGVFNISWKWLNYKHDIENFFRNRNSILTTVYEDGKYEQEENCCTDNLIKYAPYFDDGILIYPMKEIA